MQILQEPPLQKNKHGEPDFSWIINELLDCMSNLTFRNCDRRKFHFLWKRSSHRLHNQEVQYWVPSNIHWLFHFFYSSEWYPLEVTVVLLLWQRGSSSLFLVVFSIMNLKKCFNILAFNLAKHDYVQVLLRDLQLDITTFS